MTGKRSARSSYSVKPIAHEFRGHLEASSGQQLASENACIQMVLVRRRFSCDFRIPLNELCVSETTPQTQRKHDYIPWVHALLLPIAPYRCARCELSKSKGQLFGIIRELMNVKVPRRWHFFHLSRHIAYCCTLTLQTPGRESDFQPGTTNRGDGASDRIVGAHAV